MLSTTKQAEASRRHYANHRESVIASNAEVRKKARLRNRDFVSKLKSKTPCLDCGGTFHPAAMEFHHVGPKAGNVGEMVNKGISLARLEAEIAQCELVCANCHRVRHAS